MLFTNIYPTVNLLSMIFDCHIISYIERQYYCLAYENNLLLMQIKDLACMATAYSKKMIQAALIEVY